ncbi:MAG: hypothetical protein QMD77_02545 [Patescibacteria group bacterium]|nr:hypothetical protein [Patescibacteria group bacterium]
MKKVYYILIPLFIVMIASSIYFVISKKRNTQNLPPQITSTTEPSASDEKMTLTISGGDIKINNLYKNPVAKLYHNGVLFKQTPDFEMSFYPDDQGFIISLLNPDLKKSRDEAEKEFLEELGINKEQACLLKISLGVTADINEKAAGANYGLSFCPNGKPLPTE